jgi:hypothetical protein
VQAFCTEGDYGIMSCYLGCGTQRNRWLWIFVAVFAVPMAVCWFTFGAFLAEHECASIGAPRLQSTGLT